MISIWNLLWIVPMSTIAGVWIAAIIVAGSDEK